ILRRSCGRGGDRPTLPVGRRSPSPSPTGSPGSWSGTSWRASDPGLSGTGPLSARWPSAVWMPSAPRFRGRDHAPFESCFPGGLPPFPFTPPPAPVVFAILRSSYDTFSWTYARVAGANATDFVRNPVFALLAGESRPVPVMPDDWHAGAGFATPALRSDYALR